MPAQIYAPALVGLDNVLITIECDVTAGLPGFMLVGLGNKAVAEARERVRSAIKNSHLLIPPRRITLNLAPADLPKDGSGYDLGIAVAVLLATNQLAEAPDDAVFFGELALDGGLRPVRGALLAAQLARESGYRRIFVPAANAEEASLIEGVDVIGVHSLAELYQHLIGAAPLAVTSPVKVSPSSARGEIDLADIYGQTMAKRALELAAAGCHNLLLIGPPGAGKTMLAKALIGLLPPPSFDEMLEITKLASLARNGPPGIVRQRPFRAPHHSASSAALIGGGGIPRPGEISLAHHGVLFLDEIPEFPRPLLEMLRQPLEDGHVVIARATGNISFPAEMILVATANPCPCGYLGDALRRCTCTMAQINGYQKRLSGPLLDRIDLVIDVARVQEDELAPMPDREGSEPVAARVAEARERQRARSLRESGQERLNARLSNHELFAACRMAPQAEALARRASTALGLSARAYTRLLKVALTIADLEGEEAVSSSHVSEALQYRSRQQG